MRGQFQNIREEREQDRVNLNSRMDITDEKVEKLRNEMKGDIRVEFQKVRGEFQEETENMGETLNNKIVSEKHSETVSQIELKLSSSKKRRIGKIRLLKSLDIKISKFRKRQEKETRLGRVQKPSESDLTKCNGKPKHKVFRTNPNKVETKAFQSRHDKVKSQNGSLFGKSVFDKTQNMCVEQSRRLGESQSPNINNVDEKSNIHNEHSSEKLTNCQAAKRKSRLKNSLERQEQVCTNCQILQCIFQNRIKLSTRAKKLGTNWPKVNNDRVIDKKIPFKMKRNVVVKSKQMKVKMKEIWKQLD
jgi:hypothetical protein